jgi:Trk K+ transport system NAD-binding subunit
LVTVFRGPFLIPPTESFVFRVDDIVIAIGLRTDLDRMAAWFVATRARHA